MELQGPSTLRRIGVNKFYYRLREDKKQVFKQTLRFYSNGPFKSHGKLSIYIPEESFTIQETLSFCKKHVTRPKDAPAEWNLNKAWKQFDRSGVFASLSDTFQAFDREKKPISTEKLGPGFYTLRLHLPGVYLGDHDGRANASLQVKVSQLIYEPDADNSVCLID